jgi:phosphomevalonate kinase
MIAGEYAVLEPNQKAVVLAVNRYVTAQIKFSRENQLTLPQLHMVNITWEIGDTSVQFNVADSRLSFLQSAIAVTSQFLREKSEIVRPFQLEIESELDDPSSGKKYGLGSSAAVVVAVISSILRLHSGCMTLPTPDEIFKLSAIAHYKTQGSGSGADVAAAVYGGWLEYSAFNGKWVLKELEQGNELKTLIGKVWPNFSVRRLSPPPLLKLAVGWTKEAASTAPMIKRIKEFCDINSEAYNGFLSDSSAAVAALIQSFDNADCNEAIKSLGQNRKVLQTLSENAGISIETKELKTLCDIAERFGSGKSSGAGGGDCGVAFLRNDSEREELFREWKRVDISPLDISVSEKGVSIFNSK